MTSTPSQTNRSHQNGSLYAAMMLGASAVVAVFAVWRLWSVNAAPDRTQVELSRLRILGIATNAGDLKPKEAVPDDLNAANGYQEAIRRYHRLPSFRQNLIRSGYENIVLGANQFSIDADEMRKELTLLQPTFGAMAAAGKKPAMDAKRKWEQGPLLLFPDYAYGSTICRALIVQAVLEERNGSPLRALDRLDSVARMAHHIGQEPLFLSMFMKASFFNNCRPALLEILKGHGRDASVLQRTREVLIDFGPPPPMRPAVGGEVVSLRTAAEKLSSAQLKAIFGVSGAGPLPAALASLPVDASTKKVRQVYEAQALQSWRELATRLPISQSDFVGIISAFREEKQVVNGRKYWGDDLFKAMFVGASHVGEKMAEYEAKRRLMLCAVDALVYRRSHRTYPTKLVSDGPTSIDPYTGKPLAYVRYAEGFMVYSFGPNGQDDCGDPKGASWTKSPTDDIPLTYP